MGSHQWGQRTRWRGFLLLKNSLKMNKFLTVLWVHQDSWQTGLMPPCLPHLNWASTRKLVTLFQLQAFILLPGQRSSRTQVTLGDREQNPLKSEYAPCEERGGEETKRKAEIPWWPCALGLRSSLHSGLNSIREPREETHVVVRDLCLPVPFLHPVISPHPSPHLTLPFSSGTGSYREEGRRRRRKHNSLPNSVPTPSTDRR